MSGCQALAALFDDGLVWHAPGDNPDAGDIVGKAASLERLGKLAQDGAHASFDVHDVIGNDEHVVVPCDATFSKGSDSTVGRQVQIAHVRDGKMTEYWR